MHAYYYTCCRICPGCGAGFTYSAVAMARGVYSGVPGGTGGFFVVPPPKERNATATSLPAARLAAHLPRRVQKRPQQRQLQLPFSCTHIIRQARLAKHIHPPSSGSNSRLQIGRRLVSWGFCSLIRRGLRLPERAMRQHMCIGHSYAYVYGITEWNARLRFSCGLVCVLRLY